MCDCHIDIVLFIVLNTKFAIEYESYLLTDSYTLAIKKPTEPVLASSPSPKSVSKYSQLKDQKGMQRML